MLIAKQWTNWRYFFLALAIWVGVSPLFTSSTVSCGCKQYDSFNSDYHTAPAPHQQPPLSCCDSEQPVIQKKPACCSEETVSVNTEGEGYFHKESKATCSHCSFCVLDLQLPEWIKTEKAKTSDQVGIALFTDWELTSFQQYRIPLISYFEQLIHSPPHSRVNPRAPPISFFCL